MKKIILTLVGLAILSGGALTAQARDRRDRHHDDHRRSSRSRQVYVIERNRPVRRSVFIDERGRYFQESRGRRVFVTRYYNDYPSRYYYPDGRRRLGISLHFD